MYQVIYKCRLCNEFFRGKTADKSMALQANAVLGCKDSKIFKGESPNAVVYKTITHHCQDGSFGLADFMGFKKTEE